MNNTETTINIERIKKVWELLKPLKMMFIYEDKYHCAKTEKQRQTAINKGFEAKEELEANYKEIESFFKEIIS